MYKQIGRMTVAKNFRFVPNNDDKAWLYRAVETLEDNGLLVTEVAFYRKRIRDGKTFLLCEKSTDTMFPDTLHNVIQIEGEINKMKMVSEAIGIGFMDIRSVKSN